MELKAKLIQLLPLVTGEGKNGPWKKQEFIIETEGQYSKKVCFSMWGDKINMNVLKEGNHINIFFDPESREANGRWFTELRAWKVETIGEGSSNSSSTPQPNQQNTYVNPTPPAGDMSDDLPF